MAKKTLIIYYSWEGNTKNMAEKINGEIENSDLKEVTGAPDACDAEMDKTNDLDLDHMQGQIP